MRKRNKAVVLAGLLGLGSLACDRQDDTDAEERIEEGARDVGEAVGEAVEEAGQAIEEAGANIQEEIDGGETADSTAM